MKKSGSSLSTFNGGHLVPVDLLRAKEGREVAIDSLLRRGFRQSEDLFGRYSYLNINNVGKIPKEFFSIKKPKIVVVPPLHGNREVIEILNTKNGLNWEWEEVEELGVGFSGTAQVFAVECSDLPDDTLGVHIDELLSREHVFWTNLVPYLLAFYQSKELFDVATGTCFPDLSKRCGHLFYCRFDRGPKFLSVWRGDFKDHPRYVRARRIIEIPLIEKF